MLRSDHSYEIPRLAIREITFTTPVVADDPSRGELQIFARIASTPDGADKPYLVYLQGGPGMEAPRPTLVPGASPSWLPRAVEEYQVVFLDQRGTGQSTPVGLQAPIPAAFFADAGITRLADATAEQQAEYLTHFRADAIIRDAEALREILGVDTWSVLGQSFGGFATLHYLSTAPDALAATFFTGGLPSVGEAADAAYHRTWERMRDASEAHYDRFPQDRDIIRRLMERADEGKLILANGERVGVERFRRIGRFLGSTGGSQRLHYLLRLDPASNAFAQDVLDALPFTWRNPIYSVLHESCWADGVVTDWAAESCMPQDFHDDPTLLAAEHMHRSVFDEDPNLAGWKDAADILAQHQWPQLYDADALRATSVPGAAAIYYDDVYVPREYSLATADLVPGLKTWVTSEYAHGGLGTSNGGVLGHLLDLAADRRWQ